MGKRVIIELEFDYDTVEDSDVYEYLYQLMGDKCLDWEFGHTDTIVINGAEMRDCAALHHDD